MNIERQMIKTIGGIAILVVLLILITVNAVADEIPQGCTYTAGYWKTHSIFGPAGPRHDGWDNLQWFLNDYSEEFGENLQFYGKYLDKDDTDELSWYGGLLSNPKKRNAYFLLTRQYVTATLNVLNGAEPPPVVSDALGEAYSLLDQYDPRNNPQYGYNWKSDPDKVRDDFVRLSDTLERFNSGLIGPGLCQ